MGKWVVIPLVGGSIYYGRGSKYHEYEGRYTMVRGVKIPWVSGSKYRGKGVKIQYTPSVSTIILSGPTYSSQNVRQMSNKFESQHSLSPTIRFFFTFLEVNMSNIM